jgi:putative transposase
MDTENITTEYRLSQWAQLLKSRLDSGQSIKDFCQTIGIKRNVYFYWQRKLRKVAGAEFKKPEDLNNSVPGGWMQIAPLQQMKPKLEIEVNGCHLSVNAETDTELLAKICRVLRSL